MTYLPTILMNIINQATNYLDGTQFSGDIIKVNMTCMMVLSALYVSVSNSLPTTSYIKYVEIWLIFSLIYPFLIVLIQTFIQKANAGKVINVRIGNVIAKYLIPIAGLTFSVGYFSIGMYYLRSV